MNKHMVFIIFCILTLLCTFTFSADANGSTNEISLNYLEVPTSPASTILGTSITDIENLSIPKILKYAVSDNLQKTKGIPSDFAFDFTPAQMWNENISESDIRADNPQNDSFSDLGNSVLRNSTFSFAFSGDSDVSLFDNSKSLGCAYSTSFIRGQYDKGSRRNIQKYLDDYIFIYEETVSNDPLYNTLKKLNYYLFTTNKNKKTTALPVLNKELAEYKSNEHIDQSYINDIIPIHEKLTSYIESYLKKNDKTEVEDSAKSDEVRNDIIKLMDRRATEFAYNTEQIVSDEKMNETKNSVKNYPMRRVGFKWNAAAAWAFDFQSNGNGFYQPYDGNNRKWGVWTTLENENMMFDQKDLSMSELVLFRILNYPHSADNNTFELGARWIINSYQNGMRYSFEGLYDVKALKQWKVIPLILDYQMANNSVVSLSVGSNYGKNWFYSIALSQGFGSTTKVTK